LKCSPCSVPPYNQTTPLPRMCMPKIVLRLIDGECFDATLSMKPIDLFLKMERQEMRSDRPSPLDSIHRPFSVDVEGDILDAWDSSSGDAEATSILEIEPLDTRLSALYCVGSWACVAEWICWDARAYLYIEPYVSREMSINDLLDFELWLDLASSLSNFSRREYVDKVTQDWMSRRDDLGAPVKSRDDPHLMSTMSAHRAASSDLHRIATAIRKGSGRLMLGIEQTPPSEWLIDGLALRDMGGVR